MEEDPTLSKPPSGALGEQGWISDTVNCMIYLYLNLLQSPISAEKVLNITHIYFPSANKIAPFLNKVMFAKDDAVTAVNELLTQSMSEVDTNRGLKQLSLEAQIPKCLT